MKQSSDKKRLKVFVKEKCFIDGFVAFSKCAVVRESLTWTSRRPRE